MSDEKVWIAALAGLLHDIGKFAQRAGDQVTGEWSEGKTQADFGYQHALHTWHFVNKYLPASIRDQVRMMAAFHHRPQNDLGAIVQLADHLSAGEREDDEDNLVPYLRSVFSRLQQFDEPWYLPLRRLQFDQETLFPRRRDQADWSDTHSTEYRALWEQFEQACQPLREVNDPVLYLEILYQRMQEYTWCIPSAYYRAVPDVSLYDHSRMTAALAACLAQDGRDGQWCRSLGGDDDVVTLVAGDVSGVQHFIYTLTSSGAAKTLRGRSFYVQLLTEVVADFMLRQMGLPPTNLLYAGGGNFYILTGLSCRDRLADLSREVTQRLVQAHRGAMHLTLAWTPLKRDEFERTRFADAWRRLHEDCLLPAKHRPLAALPDQALFELVGAPLGVGGDADQCCSICGAERSKAERFEREEVGAEEIRKCELCRSFERLGSALAHATHLVWLQAPIPPPASDVRDWRTGLASFGARIALVNAGRPLEEENALPSSDGAQLARLSQIRSADETKIRSTLKGLPVIDVTRPLAQLVPLDKKEQPLTFDELADQTALKRWGVLRMDVDNLGRIFQHGFEREGENNLTLSRLADLSLSLRLFFEGWLPQLAPADDALHGKLYLQYAGGDDLFVVGTWDALPRFAERVRESFSEFVCRNPGLTLSAGISLADRRYPLYQAAREAEEAEKLAKRARDEKNALTFLGQPVAWEQFSSVRQRADALADWCTRQGGAHRSLLQTLIGIAAEHDRTARSGKTHYGRWMWMLAYQLTRAAARVKDEEVKKGIIAMRQELLRGPDELIQTIGLSTRWAELLVRARGDESRGG